MQTQNSKGNLKTALSKLSPKTSLGVRGHLLIGFGSITLIFLILVGITLANVRVTKSFTQEVLTTSLPSYDALIDFQYELQQSQLSLQLWMLTGDDKYKKDYKLFWTYLTETGAIVDNLQGKWTQQTAVKNWQDIKAQLVQLKEYNDKVMDTPNKLDSHTANIILTTEILPTLNQLFDLLNTINVSGENIHGLLDMQSDALSKGTQQIKSNLDYLQISEYVLLFFCITISILIAIFTSRSIVRHLNSFREHSTRIASGDLTQYINVETNDEIGLLGQDLNKMTEGLANITGQITDSCLSMVSSLEEVRHAIEAQSSGSSQQASSINEITVSLSEIEKSSLQTMDKAKMLGEMAERTQEKGQTGLEAVEQSIHGMKTVRDKVQIIAQTILDLSNQTQQVGEITAVVNNLAQQSKMLALNASIEAAKAGEAGKGFSVVAVEVKNLAEQSEQATAQVQKILEDIRHAAEKAVMVTEEGTKGVDLGTHLVEQTGDVIRNLNDVIHETTIATQQIEAAVRQEGAGIEQITAGMNEINQVTSSFVESSKQTKEAMGNLSEISKNLKKYVDVYKV